MIKRILIVQTAFIGDVILITPLIRETHKLFPNCPIDVLVARGNQSILLNNPHINKILTIDKKSNLGYFKCLKELIKNKYSVALTPHRSARTLTLLLLAGIKVRIGFNSDIYRRLLNYRCKHPQNVHKAEKNLGLLTPFISKGYAEFKDYVPKKGAIKLNWESELFFSETDLACSKRYLKPGINLAIAPGSIWNTKRWSAKNYSVLVKLLADQGFNLIFIGSKAEKDLAAKIMQDAGVIATNSCGELSILGSAALISQCQALICNDSGALHIANAVDTQVFAFFGPTVKKFGYYPYRKHDHLFEIELECRPCGMHGHRQCPLGHHNCMEMIKPQEVFNKIIECLQR
ncbi:MAG: glycosyltransferase family 9 protein [Candidatus Cloacimonadales bacterium]